MSIQYIGLGASGEIGDSAHYLDIEGTSILLDAGVHPRHEGLESLPDYERIRDVDLEPSSSPTVTWTISGLSPSLSRISPTHVSLCPTPALRSPP